MKGLALALAVGLPVAMAGAAETVVFQNNSDNGSFTPFNTSNATTVTYGDSGWLGFIGDGTPTFTCNRIVLGLATFGSDTPGSAELVFTFNDGDPSGLVFGPGTEFYSTTINIDLPAAPVAGGEATYFDLSIPLPSIVTTGGFNNIGWSVSFNNFAYAGQFGFQVSTASGQAIGFYTNNASFHDGSSWSLFSFGPDTNTGVANYVATIIEGQDCVADVDDGSGFGIPDGGVTVDDLLYYLSIFNVGDLGADVDDGSGTGVTDGGVTIDDLLYYLVRFNAGC